MEDPVPPRIHYYRIYACIIMSIMRNIDSIFICFMANGPDPQRYQARLELISENILSYYWGGGSYL